VCFLQQPQLQKQHLADVRAALLAAVVDPAAMETHVNLKEIVHAQIQTAWEIAVIHIGGVPACERHAIRARNVGRAVR
jgi:hypothetical protein